MTQTKSGRGTEAEILKYFFFIEHKLKSVYGAKDGNKQPNYLTFMLLAEIVELVWKALIYS